MTQRPIARLAGLFMALSIPLGASAAPPPDLPAAIWTDPPTDPAHPARMAVLHIPSHGVAINGVAYIAAGPGDHPTVVICHGLPGNEKNLDLAQAVRRAGWNAVTFNYRGAWGSPGVFRFGQNIEDADAVLAWLEDPANARALGVDTHRLVIIGHSMGGWVAINAASRHPELAGLATVSAADMARLLNGVQTHVVACDDAAWRMFGVSMAGYNAAISATLSALSFVFAYRSFRRD